MGDVVICWEIDIAGIEDDDVLIKERFSTNIVIMDLVVILVEVGGNFDDIVDDSRYEGEVVCIVENLLSNDVDIVDGDAILLDGGFKVKVLLEVTSTVNDDVPLTYDDTEGESRLFVNASIEDALLK